MSRSSPPRRRAGHAFWASPPGRSTAARSPMGWTRTPARGRQQRRLPPPVTMVFSLCCLRFQGFLVEKWGKEKERRVPAAVFGRATPLTAAGQAAGRGEEAGRPPPVLCWAAGGGGENEGILGFQGSSALYTPPISVGAFSSVDLRSTAAMHQRPCGLISAQAGGSAGPLRRPSRRLLGPEPMRVA
jgi:hypothetical protein